MEKRPPLQPCEVQLEGLNEPVLIHRFTWDDFRALLADDSESEDRLKDQVITLLNGPGHQPTDHERQALGSIFTIRQIRDIYRKGLAINGVGEEAAREAEKK